MLARIHVAMHVCVSVRLSCSRTRRSSHRRIRVRISVCVLSRSATSGDKGQHQKSCKSCSSLHLNSSCIPNMILIGAKEVRLMDACVPAAVLPELQQSPPLFVAALRRTCVAEVLVSVSSFPSLRRSSLAAIRTCAASQLLCP